MRVGKILRVISEERHPDKLVSQFITASTASQRFRDNRRVYQVAVSRLAYYGRRDVAASGGARNLQLGMPHVKKFQSKYTI